jgi:NAD(P)-dependent dehydrogenase (short-subunit alcohol dehydrogenase family)
MPLRILLVGASGTIGRAVDAELASRHDVVRASANASELKIDVTDVASIERALDAAGPLDAVVSAVGEVAFAPLAQIEAAPLETSAYGVGLRSKLMGQVNLTLAARGRLRDGGSITLTTGVLACDPIVAGSSASMVNGALEAFVRAAAIELPRGLRINAVSPTVLTESMGAYGAFFRGFESVPAARVTLAYSRSVEGAQTGRIYTVV